MVLEKTLESPLETLKEIQPVHPKGDQSWVFMGKTDAEAETPILWPPDAKSWLIWKDPDAGKDWGQEEKGMTEDEMVGWHQWLNGLESEWTLGVGDGQGGLLCCNSWGRKESDTTEWLNWTESEMEKRILPNQGNIPHWLASLPSGRQVPDPRFLKSHMGLNCMGILLRWRAWCVRFGDGLRVCISYQHRGCHWCWSADHILSSKESDTICEWRADEGGLIGQLEREGENSDWKVMGGDKGQTSSPWGVYGISRWSQW